MGWPHSSAFDDVGAWVNSGAAYLGYVVDVPMHRAGSSPAGGTQVRGIAPQLLIFLVEPDVERGAVDWLHAPGVEGA